MGYICGFIGVLASCTGEGYIGVTRFLGGHAFTLRGERTYLKACIAGARGDYAINCGNGGIISSYRFGELIVIFLGFGAQFYGTKDVNGERIFDQIGQGS